MTTPPYMLDRPRVMCDTECYPNYWSIGFRRDDGKVVIIRRRPFIELDYARIAKIIRNHTIVTFNGNNYDENMILLAMSGASNAKLKEASDDIIARGMKPWEFREHWGIKRPEWFDHIDLMEVSPGAAAFPSQKLYAGRLHSRTMRDLPFDHTQDLTDAQTIDLDAYLENDLDVLDDLHTELSQQIELRYTMSRRYGMDLRSKSDAQLAEAVIKQAVEKKIGTRIYKADIRPFSFKYEPRDFIQFKTPDMQAMFAKVRDTKFIVKPDGYVLLPAFLRDEPVTVAGVPYQMGLGGLHSKEHAATHEVDDDTELVDTDVRGYYPNQIIATGKGPKKMRGHFQPVFQGIVREREEAKGLIKVYKAAGDAANEKRAKGTAESGKVMSNGTFGKTGSPFSPLYAPEMLIETTVGGQLSILMLIEAVTEIGCTVVSANTDGFVTKVPKHLRGLFDCVVMDWNLATYLVTEETRYSGLYSRDVNNYIAVTTDGEIKTKGVYGKSGPGLAAASGLKKNPDAQICSDAAVAYIAKGVDPRTTIEACADIRDFIIVRRVKGGCEIDGEYLGKAVRWYHSTERKGPLRENGTDKAVADSTGAQPCMTLPEGYALPDDLDIEWYVREAWARIQDTGVKVNDPALRGKTAIFTARLEDQKTFHRVDPKSGDALCGRSRESIRDRWIEVKSVPYDMKECRKCLSILKV
jgi:hypothetical protein